jgi:hypothetical protein
MSRRAPGDRWGARRRSGGRPLHGQEAPLLAPGQSRPRTRAASPHTWSQRVFGPSLAAQRLAQVRSYRTLIAAEAHMPARPGFPFVRPCIRPPAARSRAVRRSPGAIASAGRWAGREPLMLGRIMAFELRPPLFVLCCATFFLLAFAHRRARQHPGELAVRDPEDARDGATPQPAVAAGFFWWRVSEGRLAPLLTLALRDLGGPCVAAAGFLSSGAWIYYNIGCTGGKARRRARPGGCSCPATFHTASASRCWTICNDPIRMSAWAHRRQWRKSGAGRMGNRLVTPPVRRCPDLPRRGEKERTEATSLYSLTDLEVRSDLRIKSAIARDMVRLRGSHPEAAACG